MESLSNSMKLVTILTIKKQIRNGLTFESCDSLDKLATNKETFFLYILSIHIQDHVMKTLGEFIVEKQQDFPHATGELTALLSAIKLGAKIIHRDINKAGLVDILALTVFNVQGEAQMNWIFTRMRN